jgi:Ser/Thr protein kinase RdoA (MazF antagonist)
MTTSYLQLQKADIQMVVENNYHLKSIKNIQPLSGIYKGNGDGFAVLCSSSGARQERFDELFLKENIGALFLVECPSSSYVLKLFAPRRSDNQCSLEPNLARWLQDHDFDMVAPVVPTAAGEMLCQWKDRKGTLSQYVPSRLNVDWYSAELNAQECSQAGAALAQLHSKLSHLDQETLEAWGLTKTQAPSSVANNGLVGVSSVLPHIDTWLSGAFAIVETQKTKLIEPVSSLFLSKQRALLQMVEDSKTKIENALHAGCNNQIIVHGDFHPGNLRWKANGISAIIDFENAHYELPIYDLAYGLVVVCSNWQETPGRPPVNIRLAKAFLEGYLATADWQRLDRFGDLLGAQIDICIAVIAYWLVHSCRDSSQHAPQLGFLTNHFDEIRSLSVVY